MCDCECGGVVYVPELVCVCLNMCVYLSVSLCFNFLLDSKPDQKELNDQQCLL